MLAGTRSLLLAIVALVASGGCLDWDALYGPATKEPLALWDFEGTGRKPTVPDLAPRDPNAYLVTDVKPDTNTGIALENGGVRFANEGRLRPPFEVSADLTRRLAEAPGFSLEGWLEVPAGRNGVIFLLGPAAREGPGNVTLYSRYASGEDELVLYLRTSMPLRDAGTAGVLDGGMAPANPGITVVQKSVRLGAATGAAKALHFASTFDRTTGQLTMFVDGAVALEWNAAAEERSVIIWDRSLVGDLLIAFGADGNYANVWSGRIDLFAIYDFVLAKDHVSDLFRKGRQR
jgi:hypothetical protein